jgi:hypothetical protein
MKGKIMSERQHVPVQFGDLENVAVSPVFG